MRKFQHRKILPEIIDDFDWSGHEMDVNLEELEWINKNLGGIQASVIPAFNYFQRNLGKSLTLVDIGCGSGDLLRYIDHACAGRLKLTSAGIDANGHIIDFARRKSAAQENITFQQVDVFKQPDLIPPADVYILNLFLHHF